MRVNLWNALLGRYAVQITTKSPLPDGRVGQPYSFEIQATGGSGIYTWGWTAPPLMEREIENLYIGDASNPMGWYGNDQTWTVDFTDLSSGNITSWYWNLGDGTRSTDQNPTNSYTDYGRYTISFTVTGPAGSDKETKLRYIEVGLPGPISEFSAEPTEGGAPLTVQFTDESTVQGDFDDIMIWEWDFGDDAGASSKSIEEDPSHTYLESGDYIITLTVTDSEGQTDTVAKTEHVTLTNTPHPLTLGVTPANGGTTDPNAASTNVVIGVPEKVITALFIQVATLTMQVSPPAGGTTTPPVGSHVYDLGTVVPITATPAAGYRFDH